MKKIAISVCFLIIVLVFTARMNIGQVSESDPMPNDTSDGSVSILPDERDASISDEQSPVPEESEKEKVDTTVAEPNSPLPGASKNSDDNSKPEDESSAALPELLSEPDLSSNQPKDEFPETPQEQRGASSTQSTETVADSREASRASSSLESEPSISSNDEPASPLDPIARVDNGTSHSSGQSQTQTQTQSSAGYSSSVWMDPTRTVTFHFVDKSSNPVSGIAAYITPKNSSGSTALTSRDRSGQYSDDKGNLYYEMPPNQQAYDCSVTFYDHNDSSIKQEMDVRLTGRSAVVTLTWKKESPQVATQVQTTGLLIRIVDAAGNPVQGVVLNWSGYTVDELEAMDTVPQLNLTLGPSDEHGAIRWETSKAGTYDINGYKLYHPGQGAMVEQTIVWK